MSGYGDSGVWTEVQKFLPERLHFTAEHRPVEEYWECRGHKVHLDRWRQPDAKIRLILFHGVGTNGRLLSMIIGRPLHEAGFEVVAIDMPGYGATVANPSSVFSYDDWVKIGSDLVDHELQTDARPIALYGLSAGGMETYHVAAINKKVRGIIGMTFMDMHDSKVGDQAARNVFMSRVGTAMASFSSLFPGLRSMKMPMWLASRMYLLTKHPEALKVLIRDPASGGSWSTMKFLSTYASYKPALQPEEFDVCPILLTQPVEDAWTPRWVSERFLSKIKKVDTKIVELENAGHYPLEDPGLKQLAGAIVEFLNKIS